MKFSEEFPDRFLKPVDIEHLPQPVRATITNVDREEVKSQRGTATVLVTYTAEFAKGIKTGKQMARLVVSRYGDDMDAWQGQPIDLVAKEQEYGGEVFDVIRFQLPKAAATVKPIPKSKVKADDS